jgi:hypothetical protein
MINAPAIIVSITLVYKLLILALYIIPFLILHMHRQNRGPYSRSKEASFKRSKEQEDKRPRYSIP